MKGLRCINFSYYSFGSSSLNECKLNGFFSFLFLTHCSQYTYLKWIAKKLFNFEQICIIASDIGIRWCCWWRPTFLLVLFSGLLHFLSISKLLNFRIISMEGQTGNSISKKYYFHKFFEGKFNFNAEGYSITLTHLQHKNHKNPFQNKIFYEYKLKGIRKHFNKKHKHCMVVAFFPTWILHSEHENILFYKPKE